MLYKKIFRSRKLRSSILRFLSFIPDEPMLKLQYRIKMGRKLDLRNPKRYSEKIQWYKLYYRNQDMVRCVDKYDVRNYLIEHGFEDLLVKCYGVFENADEIDFEKLPNAFVIKDTLAGGGNSVILVQDKSSIDEQAIRKQLQKWINTPIKRDFGREWPYYSGKRHRILIEEMLVQENKSDEALTDYKFLCFDDKVCYLQLLKNRKLGDSHLEEGIFDSNMNMLDVYGNEHGKIKMLNMSSETFYELKHVAEKLCKGFPHVRVDLYYVNNTVYFGELTFFPASGYKKFSDDKFDYILGEKFVLPKRNIK